jgi:predicted ATPase
LNHTILSDPRLGGQEYRAVERCRRDLERWRIYYLDPRIAMRAARPPREVTDIGVLGENVAPFLYRLKGMHPRAFEAVKRTLRSVIPSIEDLIVDRDERRGTLDVLIRQDGTEFSSRIISEGTLRVLALCAIVVNPRGGSLIGFEEPENGVHPRRIELTADLLAWLACDQGKRVIVTTHPPSSARRTSRKPDSDGPTVSGLANGVRAGGERLPTPLNPLTALNPRRSAIQT